MSNSCSQRFLHFTMVRFHHGAVLLPLAWALALATGQNVSEVNVTTILSDTSKDKNVDTAKAHFDVGVPAESIEAIFKEVDQNNDDMIDFREFAEMMRKDARY